MNPVHESDKHLFSTTFGNNGAQRCEMHNRAVCRWVGWEWSSVQFPAVAILVESKSARSFERRLPCAILRRRLQKPYGGGRGRSYGNPFQQQPVFVYIAPNEHHLNGMLHGVPRHGCTGSAGSESFSSSGSSHTRRPLVRGAGVAR